MQTNVADHTIEVRNREGQIVHEAFPVSTWLLDRYWDLIIGHWLNDDGSPTPANPLLSLEDSARMLAKQHQTNEAPSPTVDPPTPAMSPRAKAPRIEWHVDISTLDDFLKPGPKRWSKLQPHFKLSGKETLSQIKPSLHNRLPDGLDLTTAEVLTFFPGHLKGPFFVYRCISVGWEPRNLLAAMRYYRKDTANLEPPTLEKKLCKVMEMLTGHTYSAFSRYLHVPVSNRPKFKDYTRAALASHILPKGDEDYELDKHNICTRDASLSELAEFAEKLPKGEDVGILTVLVGRAGEPGLGDLKMSELKEFSDKEYDEETRKQYAHDAVKDQSCAENWLKPVAERA